MEIRDIIFRGKRTDKGEWIEGCLVKLGRKSFSDPERYGICNKAIPIGGSGVCYNLKIDEFIPETVGQYTGLTDKNGKKIFEGDIVKAYDEIYDNGFAEVKGKVFFNCGSFDIDVGDVGYIPLYSYGTENIEVIGNIHDNKELLNEN